VNDFAAGTIRSSQMLLVRRVSCARLRLPNLSPSTPLGLLLMVAILRTDYSSWLRFWAILLIVARPRDSTTAARQPQQPPAGAVSLWWRKRRQDHRGLRLYVRCLSQDDRPSYQLLVSSGFAIGPASPLSGAAVVVRAPPDLFDELALALFKRIQFLLHRLLKAVPTSSNRCLRYRYLGEA
jgi:hypothetical protein